MNYILQGFQGLTGEHKHEKAWGEGRRDGQERMGEHLGKEKSTEHKTGGEQRSTGKKESNS